MSSAKLYYFNLPGKGEAIRLACAHSAFPLEDIRITRDEFIAMKESGKLPFGQVPLLELPSGECLSQSAAIMRYIGMYYFCDIYETVCVIYIGCLKFVWIKLLHAYVGKKTGMYPEDDVKACLVDGIIDEEIDLFMGLAVSRYTGNPSQC